MTSRKLFIATIVTALILIALVVNVATAFGQEIKL